MLWFEGHILFLRKSVCLCFLNSILVFIQVHVYMYVIYVWGCPWRPEEGIRYPGAGVTGSCELLNLGAKISGPLQEQDMGPSNRPLVKRKQMFL